MLQYFFSDKMAPLRALCQGKGRLPAHLESISKVEMQGIDQAPMHPLDRCA